MSWIKRSYFLSKLAVCLKRSPVTAILGPRQCGKTSLAKDFIKGKKNVTFFDLSRGSDIHALQNPLPVLQNLKGLIVIDEIQLCPQLFPALRILADQPPSKATKYLILGSSSPFISKRTSESLAGRIAFVDLSGFSIDEVAKKQWEVLWQRGGFPRSYLSDSDIESFEWREDFVRTFFEKDIPELGINMPNLQLRRFWNILAHYHGQEVNTVEFSNSLGVSHSSVRNYLNILTEAFILRQLPPWFANIKKRQVKSQKFYFRDSGLLHYFLRINSTLDLYGNPKSGASFEGFVLEQTIKIVGERNIFFWKVYSGAEIDILVRFKNKAIGIESKLTSSPSITKSMHHAIDTLNLDEVWICSPTDKILQLSSKIKIIPISKLTTELKREMV